MPPKRRDRDGGNSRGVDDDDDYIFSMRPNNNINNNHTAPRQQQQQQQQQQYQQPMRGAAWGGRGGRGAAAPRLDHNQPRIDSFFTVNRGRGRGGSPTTQGAIPCKHFTGAATSCKHGSGCPYLHSAVLTRSASAVEGGSLSPAGAGAASGLMIRQSLTGAMFLQLPPATQQRGGMNFSEKLRAQQKQRQQQQLFKAAGFKSDDDDDDDDVDDDEYSVNVRVPWDSAITYECKFTQQPRPLWGTYETFLREECNSLADFLSMLAELLSVGAPKKRGANTFPALVAALRGMPGEEETFVTHKFLPRILPKMQDYVLSAPLLFPDPIKVLRQLEETNSSSDERINSRKVTLTQLQCTVLLCVGFFGLFPMQPPRMRNAHDPPGCNLTALFALSGANQISKIMCLLGYFDSVTDTSVSDARERATLGGFRIGGSQSNSASPNRRSGNLGGFDDDDDDDVDDDDNVGIESAAFGNNNSKGRNAAATSFVVEFIRTGLNDMDAVVDEIMEMTTPLAQIHMYDKGVIESNSNWMLQADFANRSIGGGVLNHGCVQEEIRFVISPELLLSRLLVEDLLDHEAVVMSGSLIYSGYVGYGSGFQYAGRIWPLPPPTPAEARAGIRDVAVVAFDAIDFSPRHNRKPSSQYEWDWIRRELMKAYVAFLPVPASQCASASSPQCAVATGNWGCGVFKGDLELKFVIQLVAASMAGRKLAYYTFGNAGLADSAEMLMDVLTGAATEDGGEGNVHAGRLVKLLYAWSELHQQKAQQQQQPPRGNDGLSSRQSSSLLQNKRKSSSLSSSSLLSNNNNNNNQNGSMITNVDSRSNSDNDDDDTATVDYLVVDDEAAAAEQEAENRKQQRQQQDASEQEKERVSLFYFIDSELQRQASK